MAAVKLDALQDGPLYNVDVGAAYGAHVWVHGHRLYMGVPDPQNGNHIVLHHSRLLEINTWYNCGASWDSETRTESLYVNGELDQYTCPACGSEMTTSEDVSIGVR